jgi:hypothetical protein
MNVATRYAAALAALVAVTAVPTLAVTTPKPSPAPRPTHIVVHLPAIALHSEVVVEVNKKGQVVRVKSSKPSKLQSFNLQTYGNALQMWIRRPNGTAQVGLYRITYDYDPKTQDVTRHVSLISAGGNWGDDEGAANIMIQMEHKQAAAAEAAQHRAQTEMNGKLPSLNDIRGIATPKPTRAPTLPPR